MRDPWEEFTVCESIIDSVDCDKDVYRDCRFQLKHLDTKYIINLDTIPLPDLNTRVIKLETSGEAIDVRAGKRTAEIRFVGDLI
jgi:hypothetical protein